MLPLRLAFCLILLAFGRGSFSDDSRLYFERYKALSYLAQDLGVADLNLTNVGAHQLMVRGFLNNRGEVLIGNRLWLPQPAYGRAAGWSGFGQGVRAMGLSDAGAVLLVTNGVGSILKDGTVVPIPTDTEKPAPFDFMPWDISRNGRMVLGIVRTSKITQQYAPAVSVDAKLRVLKTSSGGRSVPDTVMTSLAGRPVSGLPLAVNSRGQIVGVDFGATPADDKYVMWVINSDSVLVLGGPVTIPDGDLINREMSMNGSINEAGQAVFGVLGYHTDPLPRDPKLYLPTAVPQNPLFTGMSVPSSSKTIPAGFSSLSVIGPGTGAGPVVYLEVAGINDRGQIASATLTGGHFNIFGSGVVRYLFDAYDDILGLKVNVSGSPLFRPRAINDLGEVLTVGFSTASDPFKFPVYLLSPALAGVSSARIENTTSGPELVVSVNVTNIGRATFSEVMATNLNVTAAGSLVLSSKPIAVESPTLDLAPGHSLTARWHYSVRGIGPVVLTWKILGKHVSSGTRVDTGVRNHRFELGVESPLGLEIGLQPAEVAVGSRVSLQLTAINHTTQPMSNVRLTGPVTLNGDGGVQLLGGPDPVSIATLAPAERFTLRSLYLATNAGSVTFIGQLEGEQNNQHIVSAALTSPKLLIRPDGDLQIRAHTEKPSPFLGEDVYEQLPSPVQIASRGVETNEPAVFDLKLVNPDTKARVYSLKVNTSSQPGWTFQIKSGTLDITSLIQSETGYKLPEMPPGSSLLFEVRMTPGDEVPSKDQAEMQFTVRGEDGTGSPMDSVVARAVLFPIPLKITFHHVGSSAVTQDSLNAGQTDLSAPLEPVTDRFVLGSQPQFGGGSQTPGNYHGWVADDVTPFLVKIEANIVDLALFPEGRKFRLKVDLTVGGLFAAQGSYDGPALMDTMRLLDTSVGSWAKTDEFILDKNSWTAFLWLPALRADDVKIHNGGIVQTPNQFLGGIDITFPANGRRVSTEEFAVRKPPIFLLHGYNTAGDWGISYRDFARDSRPGDPSAKNDPDSFVRTIKYGVLTLKEMKKNGTVLQPNTTLSLEECAGLAYAAMDKERSVLQQKWAFTRFDLIGHSQGGVLARMLASKNSNPRLAVPFRNPDNLYRGRFRRVVTIGSPHNGSRLLTYIAAYIASRNQEETAHLPTALQAFQPLLQEKFNPFGAQIRMINHPDPSAPWYPDPGAQFHIIRTTIDLGRSPAPGDFTPAYQFLGLTVPGVGAVVLPRGSDGVVDFDSIASNLPPDPLAPNVFDLQGRDVSHADGGGLFGVVADYETDSVVVAAHAINALDQNPRPGENMQFGAFQLPALVPDSENALITAAAAKVRIAERNAAQITARNGLAPLSAFATSAAYAFQIDYQPAHAPQNSVSWLAEVYGPEGISSDGVILTPHGTNQREVTVTLANNLIGDVVLQAVYLDIANSVVMTDPLLVASRLPPGATLTGFELLPGDSTWPVRTRLEPQIFASYSDGTATLRYLQPGQVTVTSSNPSIVSVSDPLRWDSRSAGTARVVVGWSGYLATNDFTITSDNSTPSLAITYDLSGTITLSWPASATVFHLEQTIDPSFRSPWEIVPNQPTITDTEFALALPASRRATYFRLKR